MAKLVRSSAEYNQRAGIIEALCPKHSPTKIIQFFIIQNWPFDIVQKYVHTEKSEEASANPAR